MTLTRRFMMRITDRIREERRGLVIINGESLGQVASQTMESMQAVINAVMYASDSSSCHYGQVEIIDLAQKLIPLTFPSNLLRIAVLSLH